MSPLRSKKGRWSQQPSAPNQNKRGPWSTSEDESLRNLVVEKGSGKWVQISDVLKTRTPKQCRERWHQNLKPDLNHDPITDEEGKLIESMVQQMGKKWADIARHLSNRSDNAVKNWWNGGENRRKREQTRQAESLQAHGYQPYGRPIFLPQAHQTRHCIDDYTNMTLPPIRTLPACIPAPLTGIHESRRIVDPAEPSPISARPPSLVSDAGTDLSVPHTAMHSHHQSFTMSQFGIPAEMHRTSSNEPYWTSPTDRSHHFCRPSLTDEHNPVYRTDVFLDRKPFSGFEQKGFEHLNKGPRQQPEEVSPTDCRTFTGVPRAELGSPTPPASSSEQIKLPPCSEIGRPAEPSSEIQRPPSGSSERNAKMSVNSLIG